MLHALTSIWTREGGKGEAAVISCFSGLANKALTFCEISFGNENSVGKILHVHVNMIYLLS